MNHQKNGNKHAEPMRPAQQDRFIRWLIGILCSVLVFAGIVMNWEASEQKEMGHVEVTYSNTPTLFVSGDFSNWTTFGPLTKRLQRYDVGHAVWTIHVAKNGTSKISKRGPLGNKNPLILVLFADNHHASRESKQLTSVMQELKQKEHIQKVNFVGHSSGCNIIYQYLTGSAADHREKYPVTNKYVNIATTFSAAEKRAASRFPQNVRVLNLSANAFGSGGDFGVSVKGDQALGEMLSGRVAEYRSETITGGLLEIHYLLHQNPRIDRIVTDFIWDAGYRKTTNYPRD